MLSAEEMTDLILASVVSVNEEKTSGEQIPVSVDTILMGSGSPLDSLDFILLVSNIEDRLQAATGQAISLDMGLQATDQYDSFRTIATLGQHLAKTLSPE